MSLPLRSKIIILTVLALVGYLAYTRLMPQGGWDQQGFAPAVSVAAVVQRNVRPWYEFSGRLVAVEQAEVRPQVSGLIDSLHFQGGALIEEGELLFVIDPRPYEAALQAAKARASQAEAAFTRAETLVKEKALSQRDFDQRKSEVEIARAELTRAKLNLGYTRITSPISGRVSRPEITVGNLVEVGSGAPVLTTVVSTTPIYVDFEIDETTYTRFIEAGALGPDDTARIPVRMGLNGETGTPHEGRIQSFDNRLDPASGTLRVRAVFDNEDGTLVPGLFARVRLGGVTEEPTLLIADRAVGTDQNKRFVLALGAENALEYREVKLGGAIDGLRVVASGLKPGEKILVSGITPMIRPGMKVTPETVPMEQAPGSGLQASGKTVGSAAQEQQSAPEAQSPEPEAQP